MVWFIGNKAGIMNTTSIQFSKFLFFGGISTLLQYIVLVVAVSLLYSDPVSGSMVGYLCGGALNYYLNYKFTFKSNKAHINTTWKFAVIMIIGFSLNGYVMSILTTNMEVYYLWAQLFSTIIVLMWNFVGNKLWTFSAV